MPVTYQITVQADEGGAPLDITAGVRAVTWRLGAETPEQALAPPGRARLTLEPDGGDASVWIGRALIIRCHDGATERTHFCGLIESVTPATEPDESGPLILDAVTADAGLAALAARVPSLTDAAPGPLITALLTDLPLRRPSLAGVWVLEAPGFAELGSATRLAEPLALPVQADAGVAHFALVALGGLPVAEALRQIVVSEGGRCAVNREGVLVFQDRHRPLRAVTTAAVFSDTMVALGWSPGEDWANRVRVHFMPVTVGAPGTPLWTLERPQRLPPGTCRLTVRFHDVAGELITAWSVDRLTATATRNEDGSGGPALLEALIVAADAREAVLEFRNSGVTDAWLTTDTRLEGVPLHVSPPLAAEQTDALSMAFHGPRLRDHDLPLVHTLEEADGRARFELLRAPRPVPSAAWIEVDVRAVPSALALTPGDRIRVQHGATGHDSGYHLIGETHTVDEGGARHRIRLFLEPAPVTRFWELGLCPLDAETTLAH